MMVLLHNTRFTCLTFIKRIKKEHINGNMCNIGLLANICKAKKRANNKGLCNYSSYQFGYVYLGAGNCFTVITS